MESDRRNSKENVFSEQIFDLDAPQNEPLDEKKVQFSIYNDIKPEKRKTKQEEEWNLRLLCAQEWFIRCSWINKFLFLEALCHSTKGSTVLENVLQSIELIFTKDVLESLSNDSTNFCYDRIPVDDNRTLDVQELNQAIKEDFLWFLNLDTSQQIRVILRLLRLGGGGLIFAVYKLAEKIYNERQAAENLKTIFPSSSFKLEKGSKQKIKESSKTKVSNPKLDTKSLESEKIASNEYASKKLKQLERRDEELLKYRKLKGIPAVEDSKIVKKVDTKETVDYLQVLPIWLNRRIMSYIDDKTLSGLKKVGKYWGKMIDESINEKSGRKAINAKINKIIGITADKEEQKTEEKSENEETEFITELGAKALINKKNENEKALIESSEKFEMIFSKKCDIKNLDSSFYPERCGAFDNMIGILACSAPSNMVHFYSVRTGARLSFLIFGLDSPVTSVALHENRIHIFLGCGDGSLIIKDIRTNKTTITLNGHTKAVLSIITTPSNLLSASADNTVKYFQLWSGLCLLCIDLSSEFNISSALFANGSPSYAAIGTAEGVLVLVDMEARKFLAKVKLHAEEVKQLAQDGNFLITGSGSGKIRIWDMNRLEDNCPVLKPYYNINVESPVSSLKLYKNQIFSGCENGTVKIISVATGKILKTLKISSQTPIKGMDITENKLFTKLIIWHEKGIEIRTFSLRKTPSKKMSMEKDNRESKQKAPKETRKNKTSEMVASDCTKDDLALIEVMTSSRKKTVYTGTRKPLHERCCTASFLRTRPRKSGDFHTDVFTQTLNSNRSGLENDFLFHTFRRNKSTFAK